MAAFTMRLNFNFYEFLDKILLHCHLKFYNDLHERRNIMAFSDLFLHQKIFCKYGIINGYYHHTNEIW